MSNAESKCGENTSSILINNFVPTQQIANLESGRIDKINIPHRQRVKNIATHKEINYTVKLDQSGKCISNKKSRNPLLRQPQIQSNVMNKCLTCSRCNAPVIQTNSGKIKPHEFPNLTSHGDNDKITTFYRKPKFSYRTIRNEAGDGTFGHFRKSLNINHWLKSNWSKLTRDKWKNGDVEVLKKFTECSMTEIKPTENEIVCNVMRSAGRKEFPFYLTSMSMPEELCKCEEELTPDGSDTGCCARRYHCCKLACRIFGCRCKCEGIKCCATNQFPRILSLSALEREHLQDLYNTPCSSVQFSLCNCAVQDALVKKHTTAAHYFAHKGVRQVDACEHHARSSVCSSSTCGSEITEYRSHRVAACRSQKSYVAYSVKSGSCRDCIEDDDCCCKCCNLAMVSIDCQTDSKLNMTNRCQTDPQRKKCRPCCKCCRCNRKGGRCSVSCKHIQINSEESKCKAKLNTGHKSNAHDATCCNKCTTLNEQAAATTEGVHGENSVHKAGFSCLKCKGSNDRARGGVNSMNGSCASCKHRLNAGTNNNLFGEVIPGNEERFNIGNQDSWLTKKNIARLLGINKKKKNFLGFTFAKQNGYNACKFDVRRTPHIARKFNQKVGRRQLNKLLEQKNMQIQQQMMLKQQQQHQMAEERSFELNPYNNVPDMNGDFLTNRNCALCYPQIDQHNQQQYLHDLLATNQPFNNRNFEVLSQLQIPSPDPRMLYAPRRRMHKHRKHAHHGHTHAHHHPQRTLIYKTHSTQCITKTQEQGTSCLADFKQATELGFELSALLPFKLEKYRKLFNEVSGKFRSPISGKEYNLKAEKVKYKSGMINSEDLPMMLEIDDKFDNMPKIERLSMGLLEYKKRNDKVMNTICDAIMMTKDIGAAGEIGLESYDSSISSSNTMNSITDAEFKATDKFNWFFNEPLVYRTKTIMEYENIFNKIDEKDSDSSNDVIDLFIHSTPDNNIFTNKKIFTKNSKGERLLKNGIFTTGKRLNTTSTSRMIFNKIKNNSKLSPVEFKSFILNDDHMYQRKPMIKTSSRALEQFKSYQLCDELKNPEVITMKSVENALDNIEVTRSMPKCNIPNFIQQNLSCYSNTISDTYSLQKILDRNREQLSHESFDEQIQNVINYSSFINDNILD